MENERGIALLMTLTVITLIIAATLEMNRRVRTAVTATATTRDRFTLSFMASSGIHAAMAMLAKDKAQSPADSIQEDWANPEKTGEVLQAIPFDEGSVTFTVKDELGKIQVNALVNEFPRNKKFKKDQLFNEEQKLLWDNLLRPIVSKDEKSELNATSNIINAMKDWMDADDNDSGVNDSESDYYEGLDPPYSCRNGPLQQAEELLQIKGIKAELFGGNVSSRAEASEGGSAGGISEYITVYGARKPVGDQAFAYEGKININTAELPVLAALIGEDNTECAQAIADYRKETEDSKFVNNITEPGWYKNVFGCADVPFDKMPLTMSSDLFRIESVATLHNLKMTVSALVERKQNKKGKWKCNILNWQEE
jgi:general secretion pathway protein K